MAARNWNPSEPYVLGLEWPGMRVTAVPLTSETEYGYTFQSTATEAIDTAEFALVPPEADVLSRNTALITVYKRGNETKYGTVTTEICPVTSGSLHAFASGGLAPDLGGASTVQEALLSPNDFKYVSWSEGANRIGYVQMTFDTATKFAGKRILELKVRYTARTGIAPESPGMQVEVCTTPSTDPFVLGVVNVAGAIVTIDDYFSGDTGVRVASLGEMCTHNLGFTVPDTYPWTINDVQAIGTGATVVRFTRTSGGDDGFVQLHYVALEVTWCEENREAVGGIQLGYSSSFNDPMTIGRHLVHLRTPTGADNWVKTADVFYTATVTSPNDAPEGHLPYLPMVDGFDVFDNHRGRVAPRLPSNVLGSANDDSRMVPIKFTTTSGLIPTDFNAYSDTVAAQVYNGAPTQTQRIVQHSGGSSVAYPWLRFYARIIGDAASVPSIVITTTEGAMSYYASDLLLLPEIFDGWRQVTVRWPFGFEPLVDNSGTDKGVAFTSTTGNVIDRWEILGLTAFTLLQFTNSDPTYGGPVSNAEWVEGATPHIFADLTVTLHTDPPAVANFAGVDNINYLTIPDDSCGLEQACAIAHLHSSHLTWTVSSLTKPEFDYYEIQRRDLYDDDYATVAKLLLPGYAQWYDYEARLSIPSFYRMRVVRSDGVSGPWTPEIAVTPPVDALAGRVGTLVFATNSPSFQSDDGFPAIVYNEVFESAPSENFAFVEAGWVQQQHVYGRFGQQAFRPTERGGVQFDRDILINALALPLLARTTSDAYGAYVMADRPNAFYKMDVAQASTSGPVIDETDQSPGFAFSMGFGAPSAFKDGYSGGFVAANSNYVLIPDTGYLRFTTHFTIEAWVNKQSSLNGTVFYKGAPAGECYSLFFIGNQPHFRIIDTSGVTHDLFGGTVTPGTYAHVVGTYDGTNMRLYIDDVLVASYLGLGITVRSGVGAAIIGSLAGSLFMDGWLDEIALYDYALSPAIIDAHFALSIDRHALTADKAFGALRDLAWADIPYVCVKDDQGNRWFATVIVPKADVRRAKQLYVANVQVVESTQTPFPVSY